MKTNERLIEIWNGKCDADVKGTITQATITFEQLTPAERNKLFDLIKLEKHKS